MKEGWEYKKLGDIGTFIRGGNFSKKDFVENGFPCIHYGQIHMKFGIETFKHISSVPAEMVKPDRCARKGDLVIAITSEDDAGSCKCTAWMGDYDAYVGGHTAIYRHTMQPKYVSYYFMSPFFQKDKLEYTHGFKVVEISPKDIAKITIPVPPLSEQQSIVDYLDSAFAKIDAMKANAEKALGEAKALFQASLKEMLEPKEGWEEKTLKEICKVINGRAYSKDEMLKQGKYRLLRVGNFFTNDNWYYSDLELEEDKYCDNGDLLYAWSASFGPRIWNGEKVIYHYHIWKMVCSEEIDKYFLCYWLDSDELKKQTMTNLHGATMAHITKGIIEAAHVSFPLLSEQQSIVATLDSLKSKVDRLQENYHKISQECAALKQAILRQVFE